MHSGFIRCDGKLVGVIDKGQRCCWQAWPLIVLQSPMQAGGMAMRNPWLKRNSVMSLFLSAANAWTGAARGYASNAAKRRITAATKATARPKKKRRSF